MVIYPPRELPDYMVCERWDTPFVSLLIHSDFLFCCVFFFALPACKKNPLHPQGTTVAPPNASLAATVAADTRAALERRLNNVALTAGRTAAAVLGTLPQPPSEDSDTEADDSDTADTATTATTTATDPFPRALTEPQETPSHSPPPIAPPRSGGSGYRSCRLAARSEARPEEPRRTAAAAAAAAAAASASSLPASFLALLDGADVRRHAEAFERHGVCDEATLNQLTRHDLARVGLLPAEVHAVLSSRASPSGAVDARAASHAPEAAKGGRAGAESVAPSRPVPGQGPMFAGSHEAAAATAAADPLSAAGRAGGSASPLQGRSRGGRLWRAPGRLASSDGDARKVDAPSYQRLLKEAEAHGVAAATVAQLVSGTTDIEWIDVDPAAAAALKKVLNEVRAALAPPPPTPVPPPAPVVPPQPTPAAAEAPAAAPTTKPFNIAKQPTDKGAGIADEDCVITKLQAGGPAERAGLKVGMKIVKIAGNAVTTSAEIKQQLSTAGDAFVIDVEETASTPAPTLGFGGAAATPAFGDAKPAAAAFGAAEKKTTKPFNIAKQPTDKGAGIADKDCVITKLQAGGPAERAGLKVGMKIVKIAGNAVTTSAEIKQQLSTAGASFVIDVEDTASTPAPALGFGTPAAAATPAFGDTKPAATPFGATPAAAATAQVFTIAKQPTDKGAGIADQDCVITKLQAGGPAERAGLKVGMKITKVSGQAVATSQQVKQLLQASGPNFQIEAEKVPAANVPVFGAAAATPAPAVPAFGAAAATPAQPANPFGAAPAAAGTPQFGATAAVPPLGGAGAAQTFNIAKQPTDKGAGIADKDCVITKLQAGGPAERAGLKVGMKITKVGGQAVATSQQVKQLLQASGPNFQIEAEAPAGAAAAPAGFGVLGAAAAPAAATPAPFGAPPAAAAAPAAAGGFGVPPAAPAPFGAAPAAAPAFGAAPAVAGGTATFNIAKQPMDKGAGIADKDCVITKLQAGGPAERAGLRVGMKITKVGGQAVANSQQVKHMLQVSGPNFQIEAEAPAAGAAAPAAGFGVPGQPAAAAAANPFGAAAPAAAAAAPGPFGAQPAAAAAPGAFGAPPQAAAANPFGGAAAPAQQPAAAAAAANPFGGAAAPPGAAPGAFGAAPPGAAPFGAPPAAAPFGAQPAAAAPAFGAAAPAANPFGGAPVAAAPGFGAPAAAAAPFGGAPAQAPGAFGAPPTNPFGGAAAPAAAAQPGAFGAPAPAAAQAAGAGFGAPQAAAPFGGGGFAAAPAPAGNPFGAAPAAGGGFGAPAATPAPAFGAAPQAAAAAPFGTPAPAGGFGVPAQTPYGGGGGFGAQTPQPGGNPFGGGAAAQTPGAFATPQQPGRPYGEAATPMPPGGAGGWMQGPSPFASPMPR